MTRSALLALVFAAAPAMAQPGLADIAAAPPEQVENGAVFQFGRTGYFRALVASQRCADRFADRVAADEARFRAVAARLGARFGEPAFDPDRPMPVEGGSRGASCSAATLGSYEMKLDELAAWADRADALNVKPRPAQ